MERLNKSTVEKKKSAVPMEKIVMMAKKELLPFYVRNGYGVTKVSEIVHGKDEWFELERKFSVLSGIEKECYLIDAFVDPCAEGRSGNPAGVVLLTGPPGFDIEKEQKQHKRLADSCESLDDIVNVEMDSKGSLLPARGQIQAAWAANNSGHVISKALRKHFGWTSPCYEISPLQGYRPSEDKMIYWLMYDDNFLGQTNLAPSYYGDACFLHARENEGNMRTRGNIVVFKWLLKNKKRVERNLAGVDVIRINSDDDDLKHEYELYPITKAEIGYILHERRNALDQGKYTRRQWRYVTRRAERQVEMDALGDNGKRLVFW